MSDEAILISRLTIAVREGRLERVRELISDSGLPRSGGYALLRDALQLQHPLIAKLLLTSGVKVNSNTKTNKNTPLHLAAGNGYVEIVEMLLDRDAEINVKDHHGRIPLCNAIESRNMNIIDLLLNCFTNVYNIDNKGATALHIALKTGSLQIVRRLLDHGVTCEGDYTALCLAVEKGNEGILELILSSGTNVDQEMNGETSLHIAAKKGNLHIVQQLLMHKTCVNSVNTSTCEEGYTPMWFAVKKGYENIVELLLKHGANADAQNKDGKTILHYAVQHGNEKIVEHILKNCPDLNNESNRSALVAAVHGHEKGKIVNKLLQYGFTLKPEDTKDPKLLHAAVEKEYLTIVEELLKFNNSATISEKGFDVALHVAIKRRQEEVAKLLMSYAVDVNAQDVNGNTPIFYAIENSDVKMLKLLLANGANVKENRKLLPSAVKMECSEVVEILLQRGVDVNGCDDYGRTALHLTAANKRLLDFYPEIMPLQIKNGRRIPSKNPDNNVKENIAKLLLSRGANANARNKNDVTVLHAATQSGYVKVVEALLEYNADVNATVKTGITPLHISAQEGNEIISKMLLSKGANINAKLKDNKMTALHMAVHKSHEKVVEVLLRCGAKVDSRIKFDLTPLHIAAQKGSKKIVKALLKYGATVDSKDQSGKTALHIASNKGFAGIVRTLLIHGADINITCKMYYTPLEHAYVAIRMFDGRHNSDDDDNYYYVIDGGVSGCEEVIEILQGHKIKMEIANISKKNARSMSSNIENCNVKIIYKKEIVSMKIEKINNTNVSFYDILTNDINRLAIYALNKNIVHAFGLDDYKIKFPMYASMLESNFRKGKIRKDLLDQGNSFFHIFLSNFSKLPYNCTEKILRYLSDEDLRMLLETFIKEEGRKEVLEQGYQYFYCVIQNYPDFSYYCTEKIFSYLSNEDLRNLIEACKSSRNCHIATID